MFEFQNPAAFMLFLLIPLLFLLRFLKIFKPLTFSAVLADWNGKAFNWNGKIRKIISVLARIIMFTGFVFAVAALADPVITRQEKVYTSLGSDIVFVVDTSPSMAARDMGTRDTGVTTRLESAKSTRKQLALAHDGTRFGLVVLGSEASVYVPPTSDHTTFLKRIDEVNVGILGNGSAIGDGLSTAVCHLVSSGAQKRAIILLTDGENNAGQIHPETAAQLAASNGITVYVVGLGTIGGGRYFEVTSLDEFIKIFESVARAEDVVQNYTFRTVTQSFYKKILLWAIILFAAGWFIRRVILREMMSFRYKKILFVQ